MERLGERSAARLETLLRHLSPRLGAAPAPVSFVLRDREGAAAARWAPAARGSAFPGPERFVGARFVLQGHRVGKALRASPALCPDGEDSASVAAPTGILGSAPDPPSNLSLSFIPAACGELGCASWQHRAKGFPSEFSS